MSDKLKTAEMYYAVARDLRFQEQRYRETAAILEQIADQLCEQNMKATLSDEGKHG
jgi:hypothetical protein